jgi:hypothetical protein
MVKYILQFSDNVSFTLVPVHGKFKTIYCTVQYWYSMLSWWGEAIIQHSMKNRLKNGTERLLLVLKPYSHVFLTIFQASTN